MPLDQSPSLNDYKNGIPPKRPGNQRKKLVWRLIGALIVIVLVLGGINIIQDGGANPFASTGAIRGIAVNENGVPVEAKIFILGTDIQGQADQDGHFHLDGIPTGGQAVVVAYRGSGREYPVSIKENQTTDLGELRFVSTLEPRP